MGSQCICNCYTHCLVRHAQMAAKPCIQNRTRWIFALAGLLALGIMSLSVSFSVLESSIKKPGGGVDE